MEHLKKLANYTVKQFMHSLMGWSLAIMIITIISLLFHRGPQLMAVCDAIYNLI